MMFTIIGGQGFVGSHFARYLLQNKQDVYIPKRDEYEEIFKKPLGHVIYCAGVTADFRTRIFDTVEAHVSLLSSLLKNASFNSLLYISSTRVYINNTSANEEADLSVNPHKYENIFNLSKILGECLCLSLDNPNIKVVRLSNVVGKDFKSNNFLYSLIKDAVDKNHIALQSALTSSKDYILITDVVSFLYDIVISGKKRIYNLASGKNTQHQFIIKTIQEITDCSFEVSPNAPEIIFPTISTKRIRSEFNKETQLIKAEHIKDLIDYYKNHFKHVIHT